MLPRAWAKSDPLASRRSTSRLISCAIGTVNGTAVEPVGLVVVIFVPIHVLLAPRSAGR